MLSIIIDANAPPLALSATLGPLVRGVVEGVVGGAILIIPHESEEILALADASGCRALVSPGFGAGFARAITYSKGAGVLVLKAGLQIGPDFWPVLVDQLPLLGQNPAVTQRRGGGILGRIARLQGRVSPDQALLLPPMLAREIGPCEGGSLRAALRTQPGHPADTGKAHSGAERFSFPLNRKYHRLSELTVRSRRQAARTSQERRKNEDLDTSGKSVKRAFLW